NASFANDPEDQGGPINWRASCWEIHPVTEIEILNSDVILTNPGKIAKKPANNNAEQSRKTEVHNTTPQPGSIHSEGNDNFKYILVLLVILILVIVILIYNKTKH
ncbi:MAG TPA: hypothetical protein VGO09_01870, partial [Flavisolibacter sp.]|nr:hypothetical protein [Flavisolibacter sp.]